MASGGSGRDVEDALSKLLQMGMVDEKADEDIGVDEVSSVIDGVFDISESMEVPFRVDDDELNRVISVLKDGGGEFDDCLDGINLDLSQDFMIRILES
ncbi:hypothetical protein Tco_1577575 [Tanacetum coccineum]